MTSNRPYLIRALYDWIADNNMTPHLLVDAGAPQVSVPPHVVKDGKVVLNAAERAVRHLHLGNERITFSARFSGVSFDISVPVAAVEAIYARETGQGMMFPGADEQPIPPHDDDPGPGSKQREAAVDPATERSESGRAHLRIVK